MRSYATDEWFIHAPPERVQAALLALSTDATWWPGARTDGEYGRVHVRAPVPGRPGAVVFEAGIGPVREPAEGFTWFFERGDVRGRGEWWLEGFKDGTIVHYYLDVEPGDRGRRRMSSRVRRHRWAIRRGINALKDRLEAARVTSR